MGLVSDVVRGLHIPGNTKDSVRGVHLQVGTGGGWGGGGVWEGWMGGDRKRAA